MKHTLLATAIALAYPLVHPLAALAQTPPADASAAPTTSGAAAPTEAPVPSLGVVTVTATRPTSLPTQIPTTMHGATRDEIDRTVNATDSEDALKYFPSLLVRKRYIGDYNHAVLSSRASGTGNSARSAVYADGILLSNYLGNGVGGLSFPPRWGLVTPEEIERVDVMYGPFSAAYPGNSAGAVVDYVTRMPSRFEAHAKAGYVVQPFELYGHGTTYRSWQTSASLGSREGDWAWWVNLNRTDSEGQPLTYANRLASATKGSGATPVSGAIADRNSADAPWYLLGSATQYHTRQDHAKVKLAYDVTPTLRASYVLGLWQNTSDGRSESWLRDAQGRPVYSGDVLIHGAPYQLNGGDFAVTHESLLHTMQGLSLKTHGRGGWNWEIAASRYAYVRDDKRQNAATNPQPAALLGGAGTLADGSGTGWTTMALKGSWHPATGPSTHAVDIGYQLDDYELAYRTLNLTDYLRQDSGPLASEVRGRTRMHSVYAQDTWRIAPDWRTVLGLRAEHWQAFDGLTRFSASSTQAYPDRSITQLSPKAAVSWQARPDTVLKLSLGRAVRMPTVGELYGATSTTNSQYINDPNLQPETSWTTELSAERDLSDSTQARLTIFAEDTRDALYAQSLLVNGADGGFVTRVQNVGHIVTKGLEAALQSEDGLVRGLTLQGSVTYTESLIVSNAGYVTTPGDTIGQWQPNIPRWRATAVASYRFDERCTGTLAVRHSGRQYRTLNNSDTHGHAYMGVSAYTTADVRVRYRLDKQWHVALGIDNLNNDRYWNFHPYPQRSYVMELSADL